MNCEQNKRSTLLELSSTISNQSTLMGGSYHFSAGKQVMPWEQPDFEEFDLGMEVTAYINHWQ